MKGLALAAGVVLALALVVAIGIVANRPYAAPTPTPVGIYKITIRDNGVVKDTLVVCGEIRTNVGYPRSAECWNDGRLIYSVDSLSHTWELMDPAGPRSDVIRKLDGLTLTEQSTLFTHDTGKGSGWPGLPSPPARLPDKPRP